MTTKLEKSQVDVIRNAREENDDFNLAMQLDILYSNIEETSFRLLPDQIGLGYRKSRYLVGIMEDTERLDYPLEDVQSLMIGLGWTKTSIILRSLTHKKSVSNLVSTIEKRLSLSCERISHLQKQKASTRLKNNLPLSYQKSAIRNCSEF